MKSFVLSLMLLSISVHQITGWMRQIELNLGKTNEKLLRKYLFLMYLKVSNTYSQIGKDLPRRC